MKEEVEKKLQKSLKKIKELTDLNHNLEDKLVGQIQIAKEKIKKRDQVKKVETLEDD